MDKCVIAQILAKFPNQIKSHKRGKVANPLAQVQDGPGRVNEWEVTAVVLQWTDELITANILT